MTFKFSSVKLRPKNRFYPIHGRLRQTSSVIATILFPFLSPLLSDLLNGYANSGISMLLSSDISQSSFEFKGVGLSFFTHYLLQGMRQGFANKDNNRIITIMEAYQYVRLNVEVMTGGEQTPQIGGDFDPDIVMKIW